ncbi:MAG: hypothetical protein ACRD26_03320 [Vicinamibacterales bacterium]
MAPVNARPVGIEARTLVDVLRARVQAGDRVLLLQTDALEYIAAFCGCLYAGVIAVPAYPPRLRNPEPGTRGSAGQVTSITATPGCTA